jgi:hypothetical protein
VSYRSFVRVFTHVESLVFASLLVVWLADLDDTAKFVLGLTHGVGFLTLCVVIYVGCLRGALEWPILAAAVLLTPFGSSVGIEWSRYRERHGSRNGPPHRTGDRDHTPPPRVAAER